MSKLSNYANASAMGRENRLFTIFAALNTSQSYNPMDLSKKVAVTNKTILSLLKDIQLAQMNTSSYKKWLEVGLSTKSYKGSTEHEQLFATKIYDTWLKQLDRQSSNPSKKLQKLSQYQFDENSDKLEELYTRLDTSILVYSMLD